MLEVVVGRSSFYWPIFAESLAFWVGNYIMSVIIVTRESGLEHVERFSAKNRSECVVRSVPSMSGWVVRGVLMWLRAGLCGRVRDSYTIGVKGFDWATS